MGLSDVLKSKRINKDILAAAYYLIIGGDNNPENDEKIMYGLNCLCSVAGLDSVNELIVELLYVCSNPNSKDYITKHELRNNFYDIVNFRDRINQDLQMIEIQKMTF